ncbi:carbonic anhydrase [Artomyces pyxidatus]|uniref:Carbonic anhydrase n=1 Tax=Artomyces pyxidatus TaxID=48021 RepID=A0ACB8SKS3_9AGAM|nr:carbonic anhydrase [Artomyces pyxidatus]
MDSAIARLFTANAQWADAVTHAEPGFFEESAKGQSPKVLWIGCSDSRVPESVITASKPGDIFVHRNIANQFPVDDDSALAVLTYAVEHLGVEHVAVVGHTQCGGAAACYQAAQEPPAAEAPATPLARWIAPLIDLARSLGPGAHESTAHALRHLVEANVRKQVDNICATPLITNAWAADRKVWVHGFVYVIEEGTLKDLGVSKGPRA